MYAIVAYAKHGIKPHCFGEYQNKATAIVTLESQPHIFWNNVNTYVSIKYSGDSSRYFNTLWFKYDTESGTYEEIRHSDVLKDLMAASLYKKEIKECISKSYLWSQFG